MLMMLADTRKGDGADADDACRLWKRGAVPMLMILAGT